METYLFWIVPIASLLALALAWYFYKQMMLESEGTPTMEKIASYVRQGAMSYLKQQYKVVGLVFLGLVILFSIMAYGFNLQNPWVPIAFLTGGFFSGLSGLRWNSLASASSFFAFSFKVVRIFSSFCIITSFKSFQKLYLVNSESIST